MKNESTPMHPGVSIPSEAANAIARLTAGTISVAEMRLDLADARAETMALLIELTHATAGMWSWGVTDNENKTIAVIASIDVGFSAEQKTGMIKMGLDPTLYDELRVPSMELMQREQRSLRSILRTELFDYDAWRASQMRRNHVVVELDEWLHSVNLRNPEAWASIHLVRNTGLPPFQQLDQQLIDLAMSSIPWLVATSDRTLPVEQCTGLTSRQRLVLMMQLDGLPRKEIAARLQITTNTVGDHIKKIHEHFNIRSSGELAAKFLKNR